MYDFPLFLFPKLYVPTSTFFSASCLVFVQPLIYHLPLLFHRFACIRALCDVSLTTGYENEVVCFPLIIVECVTAIPWPFFSSPSFCFAPCTTSYHMDWISFRFLFPFRFLLYSIGSLLQSVLSELFNSDNSPPNSCCCTFPLCIPCGAQYGDDLYQTIIIMNDLGFLLFGSRRISTHFAPPFMVLLVITWCDTMPFDILTVHGLPPPLFCQLCIPRDCWVPKHGRISQRMDQLVQLSPGFLSQFVSECVCVSLVRVCVNIQWSYDLWPGFWTQSDKSGYASWTIWRFPFWTFAALFFFYWVFWFCKFDVNPPSICTNSLFVEFLDALSVRSVLLLSVFSPVQCRCDMAMQF